MCPDFCNIAFIQYRDSVTEAGTGQPVGNIQRGFSPAQFGISPVQPFFRQGIKGACRFIKD